jgi:hypothetical protein
LPTTVTSLSGEPIMSGDVVRLQWSLGAGETGDAVKYPEFADRSVQVAGTFGGATVTWEGSNDGTNYATLTDPQGNALSFIAAALAQILEVSQFGRPKVTGGAGSALTITLVARRTRSS